jgi:aspartyl-tRNA(Asn)/glutamyl-tRNA(Gln) amidotransferase subunit A
MRERMEVTFEVLRTAGAHVVDVSLPHTELAIPTYYIIAPAEASSNLSRYDGVRYGKRANGSSVHDMYDSTREQGLGAEVTRRILLGTFVLSSGYYDAYYRQAMRVRALIAGDFAQLFGRGIDAVVTPTTPTPAFALGALSDPYEMYLSDIFTVTANLAGIPAMSVPVGQINGLPVGAQIMTRRWDEARMLTIGAAIERAFGSSRPGDAV